MRKCVVLFLFLLFSTPLQAAETTIVGNACTGNTSAADWDAIFQCVSSQWKRAALWLGSSSDTCDASHKGIIQWTGATFQSCDGTGWSSLVTVDTEISSNVLLGTSVAATNPHRSGEVDTGFFSPASDTIAAATGGTERWRITSAGYVGIGTTSPEEKLEVKGGHSTTRLRLYAATGQASPNDSGYLSLWASEPALTYTGAGIGNNIDGNSAYGRISTARGASYIRLLDNNIYFNTINSSGTDVNNMAMYGGNVGIGDTTPSYKLDVAGTLRSTGAAYANAALTVGTTLTVGGDVNVSGGDLFVDVSAHRVGINDTTPSYSLDVAGTLRSTGAMYANSTLAVGSTLTVTSHIYANGTYYYGDNKIMFQYSDTWLRLNPTNAFTSGIYAGTGILRTDGQLQVGSSGATLKVISGGDFSFKSDLIYGDYSADRVGINDTTPSYSLDVAGNGRFTSTANPGLIVGNGTTGYLKVGSTGWYDDGSYFSPLGARNFYVRSNVPTSYIYSANIYLGGSSGSNLRVRGNTLFGNNFSIPNSGNTYFNSGNVGIGDTTPSYKLDVAGTLRSTGAMYANSTLTVGGNLYFSGSNPYIYSGGSYTIIPYGAYFSGGTVYIKNQMQARGGIHNDSASYLTIAGGTSGYTYFTSRVGIADATPSYSLDVNGNGRFTSTVVVATPTASTHAATKAYVDAAAGGGGCFRTTCLGSPYCIPPSCSTGTSTRVNNYVSMAGSNHVCERWCCM